MSSVSLRGMLLRVVPWLVPRLGAMRCRVLMPVLLLVSLLQGLVVVVVLVRLFLACRAVLLLVAVLLVDLLVGVVSHLVLVSSRVRRVGGLFFIVGFLRVILLDALRVGFF